MDTKSNIIQSGVFPYVVEERQLNITHLDVFSRLMMDRIVFLSGEVNDTSMDTIVAQLLFLDSQEEAPIYMYINSGGGSCYAGLELISVMRYIKSPVYTIVLGMAASMGAVIASSGERGHRMALPYSRIMVHQPSAGLQYATFKDTEIHLREMESVKKDLYEILAANSGKSFDEIETLCDRDHWMKPQEAIDLGFIDGIVTKKES